MLLSCMLWLSVGVYQRKLGGLVELAAALKVEVETEELAKTLALARVSAKLVEREVVITSRTAALAVCLPGQTCWSKSVGHEICSCQVSIAVLDAVRVPRQQANVTGCRATAEVIGISSSSPIIVQVGHG